MNNVLRKMKKDLVGGEDFNYGLGPIRAKYTPSFKTIEEIRKNKDKLVSAHDFNRAKEELEETFFDVSKELEPYYRYGADDFGYTNQVGHVLGDAANSSIERELLEYGFDDVPAEIVEKMEAMTKAMREMPTEYFEANILRAVDLGEFKIAVVPNGTSKETIAILKKRGLKIKKYNPNNERARENAIAHAAEKNNVLFMHPATVGAVGITALTEIEEKGEISETIKQKIKIS